MGELRYDIIKDAYRAERDFKRAARRMRLNRLTPEAISKILDGAKKVPEREFNDFVRTMKQFGVDTNTGEVQRFVRDSVDTLQKILKNPGM